MIHGMAQYIAKLLAPYCKEKEDLLVYGLDVLIYTAISTVGLMIIGIAFDQFAACLIIIAFYYTNQTFGGGYHAASHLQCFILMAFFLSVGLWLCQVELHVLVLSSVNLVSFMILVLNPCVLHPKKAYLHKASTRFALRSRCISCLEVILTVVLCALRQELLNPCTIGMLFSAISRLAGKYAYK